MSFPSIRFLFIGIGTAHAHSNLDPHSSKSQHNQNSQLTWFIRFHSVCYNKKKQKNRTQTIRYQLQAILPPFVSAKPEDHFIVDFHFQVLFFVLFNFQTLRLLIFKYNTRVGVNCPFQFYFKVHSTSWIESTQLEIIFRYCRTAGNVFSHNNVLAIASSR
jgi:hypothetical protein